MRRSTREKLALKEKVEALIRSRSDFDWPSIIWRDDHLSTLQEMYDWLNSHPNFKFTESWNNAS